MGKFLASLLNLVVRGDIKKIEQAFKFARQEFGEITPLLKKQIERIFSQSKKPKVGKEVKKEAEVVPFKKEGIETLKNDKSIMDQIEQSKNKIEGASNRITEIQKEIDAMYKPKPDVEDSSALMKKIEERVQKLRTTENISTGLTRTIAREILTKRGIDLVKDMDPLEIFRSKFGQDVLLDINNLAEELIEMDRMGKRPKPLNEIIEQEGFFDLKMPKEPPQGYTADELADIQKEIDQENILLKFDPKDRDPNAEGGRITLDGGGSPLQKLKQEIVESMKPYAPGVPESKLQIIVKDITFDMSPEEAQASAVSNFQKLFGMSTGGNVISPITLDKAFTKVFEDASSKKLAARDEKQATREKRYRELIASNKFPELNDFFREKITTRVQANIGGPFTTGQRQQRANQSYQDYLARQKTSGTGFQPGTGNTPIVNFPTFNPPTTTPTPPTTTPTPPTSGGGGNTGGGGSAGSAPPLYYPPNSGGGGGGNYTGGGGSTKPFDPGLPMGAASGAEAIAAYKKYLSGVDKTTTPFTSFDEWRKGTSQYSTDQLLYDLTSEEGQNQYQLDKSYLSGLKGWEDPRGGTGKQAIAEYEKYLAGLTGGSPVGFDSWRKGTNFDGSLTFQDEDYKKLLGIRDLVSKGLDSGNFKYDLEGYTGEDPRGAGPGYTEEGEGSQEAPPGYEGDDGETFLEKKKREEEEAAAEAAAKEEQEQGGGQDYFPETASINKISEASKTIDTSNPSEYSNFINANANATVGKDSKGKIFTLGNLIKAGLFVASGGLSGGIEQAITTAAKQYAKKKAIEYAKEKIGIDGSQEELPETALSNNLIGSNTNAMPFNKGGRVKLYNGGIPGFTEAEIAQRRNQQLMDAQERNRTSYSAVPYKPAQPISGNPNGIGVFDPPSLNREPQQPATPATPQQPATPGGGGSEYQTYITELPGEGAATNLPGSGAPGTVMPTLPGYEENDEGRVHAPIKDPFGMPMQMPGMPGEMTDPVTGQPQDPMLAKYGVAMSDFDKMTMDQQDDVHAAVRYTEQYGAEPYSQAMILKERGINPDQFINADGSYDRLALQQAKLTSDIQEAIDDGYLSGVTLTGNESFQDLVDLDKKYGDEIREEMANTPSYNPAYDNTYDAQNQAGMEQWNQQQAEMRRLAEQARKAGGSPGNSLNYASGGRAGFKFGTMLETSNPDFGKPKKDKSHEYLLRLLKNKQTKQLNNSLKKMVSKSRQVKDKSPEQIAKAMKKLQQLKSFYGKR